MQKTGVKDMGITRQHLTAQQDVGDADSSRDRGAGGDTKEAEDRQGQNNVLTYFAAVSQTEKHAPVAGSAEQRVRRSTPSAARRRTRRRSKRSRRGRGRATRGHRSRRHESEQIVTDAEPLDSDVDPADLGDDAPYEYIRVKSRSRHHPRGRDRDHDEDEADDDRYKPDVAESSEEEDVPQPVEEEEEEEDPAEEQPVARPRPRPRRPKHHVARHKFKTSSSTAKFRDPYALQPLQQPLQPYEDYSTEKDYYRIKVWPNKVKQYDEGGDYLGHYHQHPEVRPNYNAAARPVGPSEYYARLRDQQRAPHGAPNGAPHAAPMALNLAAESYEMGYYGQGQDRPPRWSSSYMRDEAARPRSEPRPEPRPHWERLRQPNSLPPPPPLPPAVTAPPPAAPSTAAPTTSTPPRQVVPRQVPPRFPSRKPAASAAVTHVHMGSTQTVPALPGMATMPHPYLLDIVKKYPVKIRVLN